MKWHIQHRDDLSYAFFKSGLNGVMVQTNKAVYGNDNTSIVVEFNDKNSFHFQAQSHQFPLDAILCQKGNFMNLLILIHLFCSNNYYYINLRCHLTFVVSTVVLTDIYNL